MRQPIDDDRMMSPIFLRRTGRGEEGVSRQPIEDDEKMPPILRRNPVVIATPGNDESQVNSNDETGLIIHSYFHESLMKITGNGEWGSSG